ncbi:hypothetical protein SAMN05421736_109160 [Evansella caseinilytica]|uniref:Uncharacterized protein n=1 Tax=Evansella caseinilytica TaxID=1503961 RepID=A0A1H3S0E3_9BACI|nr:hypothetical protein SAMN05421736_109160 [Evansella caseinilytica]
MIFKPRTESSESKACNILNVTMNSEKREKWDMTASKKGYEGKNSLTLYL